MVGIPITVEDEEVIDGLCWSWAGGEELCPALGDMGEYLLCADGRRFDAQRAPDGTPWAPLTLCNAKRKAKRVGLPARYSLSNCRFLGSSYGVSGRARLLVLCRECLFLQQDIGRPNGRV